MNRLPENINDLPGDQEPGPTGLFPEGKISKDDEGELIIELTTYKETIIINLGKKKGWLGFNSKLARELGKALIQRADDLDEELKHSNSEKG